MASIAAKYRCQFVFAVRCRIRVISVYLPAARRYAEDDPCTMVSQYGRLPLGNPVFNGTSTSPDPAQEAE